MTIGVERLANSGLTHKTFSPLGDHLSTNPFSRETPFISGPRHIGQSNGSSAIVGLVQAQASAQTARHVETIPRLHPAAREAAGRQSFA